MGRINWTNQAVSDLKNIYDFIASDSKFYARREISKIKLRTKSLEKHSQLGRIVPEFKNPLIRELIERRYRVVYLILENEDIDILTIHHSSRENLELINET